MVVAAGGEAHTTNTLICVLDIGVPTDPRYRRGSTSVSRRYPSTGCEISTSGRTPPRTAPSRLARVRATRALLSVSLRSIRQLRMSRVAGGVAGGALCLGPSVPLSMAVSANTTPRYPLTMAHYPPTKLATHHPLTAYTHCVLTVCRTARRRELAGPKCERCQLEIKSVRSVTSPLGPLLVIYSNKTPKITFFTSVFFSPWFGFFPWVGGFRVWSPDG